MKQIIIPNGFSIDTKPNTKPAIVAFCKPNSGSTRLGLTMPHGNGLIAFLALDQNCKTTVESLKRQMGADGRVIVNTEQFISDKEAVELAMRTKHGVDKNTTVAAKSSDEEHAKSKYLEIVDRVRQHTRALVESPDVESIVVDKASQLYTWILFSRHGRSQQIEQLSRMAPNQDMIDIISMIRARKNLLLIHQASEVYIKTGEKDSFGKEKSVATGKFKPASMGNIEGFVTATIELTAKDSLGELAARNPNEEDEDYRRRVSKLKYAVRVHACKGDPLFMEGKTLNKLPDDVEERMQLEDDYVGPGVSGEDITWDNILAAIGVK